MPATTPVTTLLIRTAGTNCDAELVHAFTLAGSEVESVHVDALIRDPSRLDRAHILAFPGGFSYGDDIASGRIFASKLREHLAEPLRATIDRGALAIGVCNGFQVLVQTGLLPGLPDQPGQAVTLTDNASARYRDDWVEMAPDDDSHCIWTKPLAELAARLGEDQRRDILRYPYAHAEGRLIAADAATLDALEAAHQIPLRYAADINGSDRAIAALTDPTGRVLGLMPHPERYLDWNHHPFWTRLPETVRTGDTPGLAIFKAAVRHAERSNRQEPSPAGA